MAKSAANCVRPKPCALNSWILAVTLGAGNRRARVGVDRVLPQFIGPGRSRKERPPSGVANGGHRWMLNLSFDRHGIKALDDPIRFADFANLILTPNFLGHD